MDSYGLQIPKCDSLWHRILLGAGGVGFAPSDPGTIGVTCRKPSLLVHNVVSFHDVRLCLAWFHDFGCLKLEQVHGNRSRTGRERCRVNPAVA
eukprot:s36_g5.t1